MIATGPFVSTPKAMEAHARIDQRRSSSTASQNAQIATTMKKASALSKMTVRANAIASGIDRNTIAAMSPSSSLHHRRANQNATAVVANVKSSAGSRAAASVGPSTSMAAASAAK